jgi:CheY-like chemotaxis protein
MNNNPRPLVIVAEDEALLRLVLVLNLEDCGFEVIEAEDGLEAFEHATNQPDCCLVVSDIRMPNMNGYALAKKLLSLKRHPPILLLTAYSDPPPQALKHRVTVLQKPIGMDELCDRAISLCGVPKLIKQH